MIHRESTNIRICFDKVVDQGDLTLGNKPFNYNTLEPKILKVNDLKASTFAVMPLGGRHDAIDSGSMNARKIARGEATITREEVCVAESVIGRSL